MQYSSSDVTTLADYAVGSEKDMHFTKVKSAIGKGLVYMRNLGASVSRFEMMLLLKAESHVGEFEFRNFGFSLWGTDRGRSGREIVSEHSS